MAAPLVPIFESPSIAWAPEEKLPSEADLVLMIYNYNERLGKVGLNSMCCAIKQKECICYSEEGCLISGVPCLMRRVKERWIEARMPLQKDDFNILRIMKKVKAKFDSKNKNRLSEVTRRSFVESLRKTTMNLAPRDWEVEIKADRVLSREQHESKIAILRDYISPGASR